MADRFASIPAKGQFEVIRAMSHDDKMALLAGLVAVTIDGTLFGSGVSGRRHHHSEQVARASGLDVVFHDLIESSPAHSVPSLNQLVRQTYVSRTCGEAE